MTLLLLLAGASGVLLGVALSIKAAPRSPWQKFRGHGRLRERKASVSLLPGVHIIQAIRSKR